MKFPSRTANYEQSIISKMYIIIKYLYQGDYRVGELFKKASKHNCDLEEFIDALDCLYIIGLVKYNKEKELICVAKQSENGK